MSKLLFKNKYVVLILICFIGFFLRFFMLGTNPPSLNWDEASTGYNAYSILKTGRDEYGNFLPLSIRSFDDYKPPLYTYLAVPFIAVFGLTDFAVRVPSAILGTLSIIIIYFLVLELCKNKKQDSFFDLHTQRDLTAITSAFFFAISPWSLQFSRAAYEGNIGLFFLMGGVLFFLKSLEKKWYLPLSSLFFVLSMYSYHSFRLLVPILLAILVVIFYKELVKFKRIVILSFIIFVLCIIPIFYSLVISGTSGTGSRLSMVTLFGPSLNLDHSIGELNYDLSHKDITGQILHNRRVVYFLAVMKGYLDHYNPDFLFLHGDGGRQHHAVDMGMLYLFDLPLILLGFIVLSRNMNKKILLLFSFMIIAPLPSAITTGTPHPVRAIALLPGFIVLSSLGAVFLLKKVSSIPSRLLGTGTYQVFSIKLKYLFFAIFFFLFTTSLMYYFHQYYVHTPLEYGDFWQYGYKEALVFAHENEGKFSSILFTYKYDQPYIYYLFYNKIDPSWYQNNWNFTGDGIMPRFERKIGKYDFRNINFGEDSKIKNSLIIGIPDEIPKEKAIKTIYFLNGQEAFRMVKT